MRQFGVDAPDQRTVLEEVVFGDQRLAHVPSINRNRARRLMQLTGVEAIYPKRQMRASQPGAASAAGGVDF